MSRPWVSLDQRETGDGVLELRRRDRDDFLILVGGRVLMNSRENQSEIVLGREACAALTESDDGRVLVGGLGMGLTLRAVLDAVSGTCRVDVAELHPIVAEWCRGPLAELTDGSVLDSRVEVSIRDVSDVIREAPPSHYDAIVLDLFEGPHAKTDPQKDPLYGQGAIDRTWNALVPGGVFGIWAEAPDAGFEKRLRQRGFELETRRPGRGGYRHWIGLARRPAAST